MRQTAAETDVFLAVIRSGFDTYLPASLAFSAPNTSLWPLLLPPPPARVPVTRHVKSTTTMPLTWPLPAPQPAQRDKPPTRQMENRE